MAILLLIVSLISVNGVFSQQHQQPLQPLGDVLHMVLDGNKDQKVTMDEVQSQLSTLEQLFQHSESDEEQEYKQLLTGLKSTAPKIFELLDSNSDKVLSKNELKHVTTFEASLKKGGGMRELVREVFGILDVNGDDQLSVDELLEGSKSDDTITKVTIKFHELFPLRKTAKELEYFIKDTVESIGGNNSLDDKDSIVKGIAWIDDDKDGHIHRKEVGKYYSIAGKKFLEISKTIKQMGPMLAMFGGSMNGGGGGGFNMDL